MRKNHKQQGFTLVELILVIAITGIIAIGSTVFIVNTAKSLNDNTRRDSLANSLRTNMTRISTQIENSVSHSIRTKTQSGHHCVEMMPIVAKGFYSQLPKAPSKELDVIHLKADGQNQAVTGARLMLSGITSVNFYDDFFSKRSIQFTSEITAKKQLANNISHYLFEDKLFANQQTRAELAKNKATHHQQIYLIDQPISYCIEDNHLYRYTDYSLRKEQSMPSRLPKKEPKRLLISKNILADSSFNYQAASNTFSIKLSVGDEQEHLTVNQKLWLDNE